MATAGLDAPTVPIGADAKLRVTVETANQPVEKSTTQVQEKSSGPLQSILGSLAETRKYLPEQVYTFLDSMEGKTLEDLRVEAMSLAGRAQEEAKKRATEVTSRGKAVVDNANSKVQDVADKARERTNSVANELVQRVVQQPVEQTKEATRSLVQKAFQTGSNVAQQSWTLTQKQIIPRVQPYVTPVVNRARTYLPQTAEKFLKENVDGKTFDQLKNVAILNTRRNLLKIDKKDQPTLQQFATEVKEAAVTGQLFWNAFLLAEKAANNVFGAATKDVPENVGALRRVYNLSWQVTNGIKDYTTKQIMDARKQAMDAASSRVNAAKENATKKVNSVANSVVWQPMNNAKEAVAPVAERLNATVAPVVEKVGQTPVIPGFVYTALRGSETKESEKPKAGELEAEKENTKTTEQVKTVPTTTVRVDIVGMQPADETKTSTTGAFSENKTASFGGNAKSMDLKDIKASATLETRDTNASSIGNLGTAGMGVTTTGSEAPTSNQGLASPTSSNKKSKGKHHQ